MSVYHVLPTFNLAWRGLHHYCLVWMFWWFWSWSWSSSLPSRELFCWPKFLLLCYEDVLCLLFDVCSSSDLPFLALFFWSGVRLIVVVDVEVVVVVLDRCLKWTRACDEIVDIFVEDEGEGVVICSLRTVGRQKTNKNTTYCELSKNKEQFYV